MQVLLSGDCLLIVYGIPGNIFWEKIKLDDCGLFAF